MPYLDNKYIFEYTIWYTEYLCFLGIFYVKKLKAPSHRVRSALKVKAKGIYSQVKNCFNLTYTQKFKFIFSFKGWQHP
jgi:hypothetical protein